MNGRHILHCRRHRRRSAGGLGLVAAVVLTAILLQPVKLYTDQHRYQSTSRQAAPERGLAMEATAYCYTGHRTKTGTWPQRGTVAVDPRVIPLGSRLYVEGYGPAIAADTGGAIKGNRVDVYLESEAAAREWGRRQAEVRVLQ